MKNWVRKLFRKKLRPATTTATAEFGSAFIVHKREVRPAGTRKLTYSKDIFRNYPCRDCSHEPHCRINEVACIAWRRWTLDGKKRSLPRGIRFLPLAEND